MNTKNRLAYPTKARRQELADLNIQSVLTPANPNEVWCGVKVVATLGPACHDVETLCDMLEAGMTVARVDLTWGPLPYHITSLNMLQSAMKRVHRQCAIMVDTVGREMMIRRSYTLDENGWPYHEEDLVFKEDQRVVITTRDVPASAEMLPISYVKFPLLATPGDCIYCGRYLNCGAPDQASLYLEVVEVGNEDVVCRAMNDASLSGLITVFIAEATEVECTAAKSDLPILTDYDMECLKTLGEQFEIDFVTTAYTRNGPELKAMRACLAGINLGVAEVVAKIETRLGVYNFKGILEQADAIVISRGNLGIDIAPEKQAGVQKALIAMCNVAGKPCLVTRVMDSMSEAPRPTRAEATDVANIVLDGADGLLLGAETLRGLHPAVTVRTAVSIARQAERVFDYHHNFEYLMQAALDAQQVAAADEDADDLCVGSAHGTMQEDLDLYHSYAGTVTPPMAPGTPGGGPRGAAAAGSAISRNSSAVELSRSAQHSAVDMVNGPASLSRFGLEVTLGAGGGMHRSPTQERIARSLYLQAPYLSKLESIASSAVRAAEKVCASLIVVFTHTSCAPQLVAKYRPPMPILTLVVPRLTSDGLHWKIEGRHYARQCLLTRGLLPMLTAPGSSADEVLEEAVTTAVRLGLVRANNFVVVVERVEDSFCIKIIAVDELGTGIKKPGSQAPQSQWAARDAASARAALGRQGTLPSMPPGASPFDSPRRPTGGFSNNTVGRGALVSPYPPLSRGAYEPSPSAPRGFLGRCLSSMEDVFPRVMPKAATATFVTVESGSVEGYTGMLAGGGAGVQEPLVPDAAEDIASIVEEYHTLMALKEQMESSDGGNGSSGGGADAVAGGTDNASNLSDGQSWGRGDNGEGAGPLQDDDGSEYEMRQLQELSLLAAVCEPVPEGVEWHANGEDDEVAEQRLRL